MPRQQAKIDSYLKSKEVKHQETNEESDNESVQSDEEDVSVVTKPSTSTKRKGNKGKQPAKKTKNGNLFVL